MEKAKHKVLDIAQWFINRAKLDADLTGDKNKLMTSQKLQALLYYAQGCCLAIYDKPLFSEKIIKL